MILTSLASIQYIWAVNCFLQPYLQSCISKNTVEHLQSQGAWSDLKLWQHGEFCAANVTSPDSVIAQSSGKANIYKCPGACVRCGKQVAFARSLPMKVL